MEAARIDHWALTLANLIAALLNTWLCFTFLFTTTEQTKLVSIVSLLILVGKCGIVVSLGTATSVVLQQVGKFGNLICFPLT